MWANNKTFVKQEDCHVSADEFEGEMEWVTHTYADPCVNDIIQKEVEHH